LTGPRRGLLAHLSDHLALAERNIAESERHIAREEQMISDLERGGHDTKLALETLANYRRMQAEHVAHRNTLLKLLQQSGYCYSPDPIFRPGHYATNAETREDQYPAEADERFS
jgi:hypothetical protein